MDRVSSVAEDFDQFMKAELPGDPPDVVTGFVRSAFYAGAGSILHSVDTITRTADTPAMGLACIRALEQEISEFGFERAAEALVEVLSARLGPGVLVMRVTRDKE